MAAEPTGSRPRRLGAAVLLVLGLALISHGLPAGAPPQPIAADSVDGAALADIPGAPAMPAATPERIRIPSIGIDAPLTGLGLGPDGRLTPPPEDRTDLAGWYAGGPAPGTTGPAIIAGHVDNAHGPSVFYGLGSVQPGATVDIVRSDHRTAVFTVDGVEVYPATAFPDRVVYGRTSNPELRVITCGGGYTKATGYLGNVVVFAHLTSSDS
ncbi:class F sortase [Streptacidiphilus sp. PB12-B1b]|uniref:class F sortase n=1 Tax=Streptacidiphilus sp. PB12-B1b TaxID=2705012 RepID=UPI0015FBBAC4|nr:class F sortase [Streptacidiphilus sp. PB12-B1b]QMU77763.1 class F sortase [Streptacidiphilus sp. PB12-B1b]